MLPVWVLPAALIAFELGAHAGAAWRMDMAGAIDGRREYHVSSTIQLATIITFLDEVFGVLAHDAFACRLPRRRSISSVNFLFAASIARTCCARSDFSKAGGKVKGWMFKSGPPCFQ